MASKNVMQAPGRSYALMRWMVGERNRGGLISNELLLAIFWERSLFANSRQREGAGFARLDPTDLDLLARETGMDVEAQSILMNDLLSVDVAISYLRFQINRLKSREAALLALADGSAEVVQQWRNAERALLRAGEDETAIARALSLARSFPPPGVAGPPVEERLFPDERRLLSA